MAINTLPQRLQINGLVDTNQNVVANMEKIARNATSWITYDTANGKWSVVINRAGPSIQSFDDSNIVGGISVSGQDVTNLYNRAQIEYPLRDTADTTETIVLEIPAEEQSQYEKPRTLNITYDMCNEPVQATLLGLIELKQSRVDESIKFTADYSTINVQAGDVIDVTNENLGWDQRLFRVVSLAEKVADNGAITIEYECVAYDDEIYDESSLSRYIRTDRTDIKSIGIIEAPVSSPVVTAQELDGTPYQAVEMIVPNGIVNSIELYASKDGTQWELKKSITPADQGEEAELISGSPVTVRIPYSLISREWATGSAGSESQYTVQWKYRGKNRYGTGPFSSIEGRQWRPKQAAESEFVGANLLNEDGSETTYTVGQIAATAEATRGDGSATAFSGATGVAVPTKDTGAPGSASIEIAGLQQGTIPISQLNANLAAVCGNATQQGGYNPIVSGNTTYIDLSFIRSYSAKAMAATFAMPYGLYDYEYYDSTQGQYQTHYGAYGYVPTQLTVWFTPTGGSTPYAIKQTVTTTAIGTVTLDVTPDDVISMTSGLTSSLAGTWRFQYGVAPNIVPTPVGDNTVGDWIYPYNWDAGLYTALQVELLLKFMQ